MDDSPRPDAFAEAARSGLTAANAATLSTCTVVGCTLSIYADVAPAGWAAAASCVALLGWLLSIALALYLAGRSVPNTGAQSAFSTILRGVRLARMRPGLAALVVMMMSGGAFTIWSKSQADQGSILKSLIHQQQRAATAAERAADSAISIRADTRAIRDAVTRPGSRSEALAELGYAAGDAETCRALAAGDVRALSLMLQMRPTLTISSPLGGGQSALCVEEALLTPSSGTSIAAGLDQAKFITGDLNRLYISQRIDPTAPLNLRALDILQALGIDSAKHVHLSAVRATPLQFAVWGNNLSAVEALLRLGSDPNLGGHLDYGVGVRMLTISVSPLEEATRLGFTTVAEKLRASGANMEVKSVPYFR